MAQTVQTLITNNTKARETLARVAGGFDSPLTAQGMNLKRFRSFAATLGRDSNSELTKDYQNTTRYGTINGVPQVGDAFEVAIWDDRKGRPYMSKCVVVASVREDAVDVLVVKGPATAEKIGAMLRGSTAHERMAAQHVIHQMVA